MEYIEAVASAGGPPQGRSLKGQFTIKPDFSQNYKYLKGPGWEGSAMYVMFKGTIKGAGFCCVLYWAIISSKCCKFKGPIIT